MTTICILSSYVDNEVFRGPDTTSPGSIYTLLSTIPRPPTAYRRIPPEMTAPRACSGIQASRGRRKIYRGFSCRDLVAEPVRLRIYRATVLASHDPAAKCNAAPSSHAPLKLPTMGIILLIKANPLLDRK